ncbi:Omp28-related outer membrane protein [Flavobacterium sp.]
MGIDCKKWIFFSVLFISFTQIFAGDGKISKLSLSPYVKTNSYTSVRGQFINVSGTNITSYRTGWKLDNGAVNNDTQTGIGGAGLVGGNSSYVNFSSINGFNVTTPGPHVLKVWVKATGDTNASNDTLTFNFIALSSYVDKINLIEESTGTWCQYCPAGATALASIKALPKTAVAVFHYSDIYATTELDSYFVPYFPGTIYTPSAIINMGEKGRYVINANSSAWLQDMNDRANTVSPVQFSISPTYNTSTRQLNVSVTSNFKYLETSEYYTNVYIVENGVVGTQVNATNPYTHNNIVRKMLGGPAGTSGIIPNTPVLNTDYTNSYSFVIPTAWNVNNLELIGMVYRKDGTTKNTLNAAKYAFTTLLSTTDFSLSPNPAHDFIALNDIALNIGDIVSIFNINGQLVLEEEVKSESVEINIADLPLGMYLIKLKTETGIITKKFIKE